MSVYNRNKGRSAKLQPDNWETKESATAVHFDKMASALAVGNKSGDLSLFDVEREKQLRDMKFYSDITQIQYNRSAAMPYLVTVGTAKGQIINNDIRIKNSVINKLNILANSPINVLSTSCTEAYKEMENTDGN